MNTKNSRNVITQIKNKILEINVPEGNLLRSFCISDQPGTHAVKVKKIKQARPPYNLDSNPRVSTLSFCLIVVLVLLFPQLLRYSRSALYGKFIAHILQNKRKLSVKNINLLF